MFVIYAENFDRLVESMRYRDFITVNRLSNPNLGPEIILGEVCLLLMCTKLSIQELHCGENDQAACRKASSAACGNWIGTKNLSG